MAKVSKRLQKMALGYDLEGKSEKTFRRVAKRKGYSEEDIDYTLGNTWLFKKKPWDKKVNIKRRGRKK